MLELLMIRLAPTASTEGAPVQWMGLDENGAVVDSGSCELAELGQYCAEWQAPPRIVALAPAQQVLLTTVEVPPGQQRYAKQAMPFLIEEKLAEDIEDVHIALGPVAREQPVPVAVVRHIEIIAWLDALYTAGLPPSRMIPEPLALPWQEGRVSVCITGDFGMVRDGPWHGMGCDLANLPLALAAILRQSRERCGAEPAIDIFCTEDGDEAASAQALQRQLVAAGHAPGAIVVQELADAPLSVMASQVAAAPVASLDLLQGGYAAKDRASARRISWRKIALTFAACVAVHVAVTTAAGLWWQWRAQELRADAVAQYQQWFPAARRVFDPRRQLQSQLNGGGGADSAALLAYIGGLAGSWDGVGESLRLRSLNYRGDAAAMSLEMEGASAAELDLLRKKLAEQGVRVELKAVAGGDDRVSGRLELAGVQ